jgi:YihY family inner membrane protein
LPIDEGSEPTSDTDAARPRLIDRVDRFQRGMPVFGFPWAVIKRYIEDRGAWLGSLIAYFGFFSLYPLLVAFTTVATWLFGDHPKALQQILSAVWSKVPFASADLAEQVNEQVTDLSGQGWIAFVSIVVSLWGAVGVVRVLQDAVNTMWGVPRYRRPPYLIKVARGTLMLGLLGVGIIGSAVIAGVTLAVDMPVMATIGAAIGNIVLSVLVTLAIYRLVLGRSVPYRVHMPGAVMMGVGVWGLTLIGGLYVQRVITRMTNVFGPFASTIGLLAYVSLLIQIFVFSTEVNVVRAKRLWPRTLTDNIGEPDRRAIALSMQREALFAPNLVDKSASG